MRREEELLTKAIAAMRSDEPSVDQIAASAGKVADRLGIGLKESAMVNAIENCGDVQKLLSAYRAGTLPAARALLVEAHLHDCGACMRQFRSGASAVAVDWSAPKAARATAWRPQTWGWAAAACAAVLVSGLFVYRAYWQVPPGVRAEVRSVDGSVYRVTNGGEHALGMGDTIGEGDHLRTSGGAHAVIGLSDGSTVEVNERSALSVGARGRDMTVSLDNGAVIVQAAKRTQGHLYVKTPDCSVAVVGTLFSVNSGIKGSRVAVLQGTVHVDRAGTDTTLSAGDQIATSDSLSPAPIEEQVAWSHDRDKYFALAAEFATLRHRISQLPLPQPRYSSDLLARVPANTLFYVSVPNLGEFLNEANSVFHAQLKQSADLEQWWNQKHNGNTAELDEMVGKLHEMSQYLGDEVVIVGMKQEKDTGFAIIADVEKSGLDDLLRQQFSSTKTGGLTVLDERGLKAATDSEKGQHGAYALVREHEVVFSPSVATLKLVDAQLSSGASGFATGEFGKQIEAAYGRGAGIILGADLHQVIEENQKHDGTVTKHDKAMENSGLEEARFVIAEHRESNGTAENHLNLQFSGTRQGIASWLAEPAPIGSLDFITPNASFVGAALSKDPKAIADDILAMAEGDGGGGAKELSEAEEKLQISIRDDLAANLGGDFLVSLDGPALPTPSWKVVIEVRDPVRLESTLEHLSQAVAEQLRSEPNPGRHFQGIAIEPSQSGAQHFYAVREIGSGTVMAQYTFSDGFMIVAPDRALLMEALRAHASGDTLARSTSFKALLPRSQNENCSAVAYQNLSPVLSPLLSQLSGERANAIRELAVDAKPSAICAWGEEDRIEAAGDSHLLGFDFLTLGSFLHSGNNSREAHVRE